MCHCSFYAFNSQHSQTYIHTVKDYNVYICALCNVHIIHQTLMDIQLKKVSNQCMYNEFKC